MEILLVLDDHGAHDSGLVIYFLADGDAADHVAELDLAGLLCDDRHIVRIPLDESFPLLDHGSIGNGDHGSDDHRIAFEFAAILAMDANRTVLGENDVGSVQGLNCAQVIEAEDTLVLRLDDRLLEGLTGRSTDVECTHRELGSRLADRLCGNDADRLTKSDHESVGEIAAIALAADAPLVFAGQNGSNLELFVTNLVQCGGDFLVDELIGLDDRGVVDGILDGLTTDSSDDAGRQTDNLFVTLVDRADNDTVDRATILGGDDDILGGINELAGQIAGVGSLESRVGKSLAGAVGRDEVLKHGKTFTEVGENRALDDLTGGLGHQTAHSCKLLDLGPVASGTGINHHEDRIRLKLTVVVLKSPE